MVEVPEPRALDTLRASYQALLKGGLIDASPAKAEAFWPALHAAAYESRGWTGAWEAIYRAAVSEGLRIPPTMFGETAALYSKAVGLRRSSQALAAANRSDAITGDMIGTQVYARTLAEQGAAPIWHARVTVQVNKGKVTSERVETLEYAGQLPATVGELRDDAVLVTGALATGYGETNLRITAIELGAW